MSAHLIGLNTTLHTYTRKNKKRFETAMAFKAKRGTVTEVFVNNGYGFEFKPFVKIRMPR